jgi:hypothetical protein
MKTFPETSPAVIIIHMQFQGDLDLPPCHRELEAPTTRTANETRQGALSLVMKRKIRLHTPFPSPSLVWQEEFIFIIHITLLPPPATAPPFSP